VHPIANARSTQGELLSSFLTCPRHLCMPNQQPALAGTMKCSRLDIATEDVCSGTLEVSALFCRPVTLHTYNEHQAASTAKQLKLQTDAPAHNGDLNTKNVNGNCDTQMGKGQVGQPTIAFGMPLTKQQEMQWPHEPGECQRWLCDGEWHPILMRCD